MKKRALVTSRGIDGIQVALELAEHGIAVTLVEESVALQADSIELIEALPSMPRLLKAATHRNINVITGASVEQVDGESGNFKITILKQPRYVNVETCTSCGRCEKECPVNIIPASNGRHAHKAIHRPNFGLKSVPSTYTIEKYGLPPCTTGCPAGINTHGYVALVAKGKFAEALDVITEAVPFPRVLGRVCSHPCQDKCTRGKVDQPIAICALKRFVGDCGSTESSLRRTAKNGMKSNGPARVAIVGAGPAGLTAARDLARLGHKAVVYEALPVPGGMITVGMPRFRLPREVRQADINDIERLGIEIRTSTPIGKDLTLQNLRDKYEAVLITTGAHKNQKLSIPGESLPGVIDSIALLRALNLKQPMNVGKKVVVVGGGYTAIDSARTAVRLGCQVTLLYRRSQEEMPANAEEVAESREEGVKIEFLVTPVRILGQDDNVVGVECIRMKLGEPDASGRRRPLTIGGSEFIVEADSVIVAVGQRPELSFLGDVNVTDGRKHIVIDQVTMATKVPGIFAAGDVAGDPGTMIEAITAGRRAAVSIDRFLRRLEPIKELPRRAAPATIDLATTYIPPIKPQPMPALPQAARVNNFEEVDLGFTEEMAVKEAKRCLNCAGCSECLECERACELGAIDHHAKPERVELNADVIIATIKEGDSLPMAITPRPGIYLMSPDGSQAANIAGRVLNDLKHRLQPGTAVQGPVYLSTNGHKPKTGVFVCHCGGGISDVIDVPGIVQSCRKLSGVDYSGDVDYACTADGAAQIKQMAAQHGLTDVVLAACSCCSFDQICYSCSDRRLRCKSNLLDSGADGLNYEFVNIREHCAWVHEEAAGTAKARSLIKSGIARAQANHHNGNGCVAGSAPVAVSVDRTRCRGCGTCVTACRFKAITLNERNGIYSALIDNSLCRGCGVCIARCPSGALYQGGYSDEQLNASLEAIL
ncbi:MAG: FAD-dependent oxidoreductase [Dehalococcoidales bacterium]|nr:FAD-dependent oxidoreductase [Dehalococcoidales bacterium]